jgi:hypothetical protein
MFPSGGPPWQVASVHDYAPFVTVADASPHSQDGVCTRGKVYRTTTPGRLQALQTVPERRKEEAVKGALCYNFFGDLLASGIS